MWGRHYSANVTVYGERRIRTREDHHGDYIRPRRILNRLNSRTSGLPLLPGRRGISNFVVFFFYYRPKLEKSKKEILRNKRRRTRYNNVTAYVRGYSPRRLNASRIN